MTDSSFIHITTNVKIFPKYTANHMNEERTRTSLAGQWLGLLPFAAKDSDWTLTGGN